MNKKSCLSLEPLDRVLATIADVSSNDLVSILHRLQGEYGYLPVDVLLELSNRTSISASHIYGVATFYEQFHLEPHGRHTIRCCRGTACHVKGGANISKMVEKTLGIQPGQTTEDMRFTFETVACLGTCFLAPAMMVNNDYYGHMTTAKVSNILESYS